MDEKDLAPLKDIGIVVLGNFLLVLAILVLVARRRGWRQTARRIMSFRDPFWGIMAAVGSWMLVGLVILPPIGKAVLLHYYFTAEEIDREHLRVVEIIGKREIVFSNGERRPYETAPKLLCAATGFVLWGATVALVMWVLTLSGNELVYRARTRADRTTGSGPTR